MNNTILKRTCVVGVLIALLFGMGMIDSVDALTNLQKAPISAAVVSNGDLEIIGPLGASTHQFVFSTAGVKLSAADKPDTPENERRNGDQLSVSVSGGYITQVRIGLAAATLTPKTFPNNTSSIRLLTMGALESNRSIGLTEAVLRAVSGSGLGPTLTNPTVRVDVIPNRVGDVRLTVTHTQRHTDDPLQDRLSLVAYAVRPGSEIQEVTIDEAASTPSIASRFAESPSAVKVQLTGPNRNYVRVRLTSSNGNLSDDFNGDGIDDVSGTTIESFTDSTGVAEVKLAAANASSRVWASIPETLAVSYRMYYILGKINLTRIIPRSTEGLVGRPAQDSSIDIFNHYKVKDSVGANLSGIVVTFKILNPEHGVHLLRLPSIANPGTYDPDFENNGRIASHTNGDVKLYFWLGDEIALYTLRATVEGSNEFQDYTVQGNAIPVTGADRVEPARIEIFSGDGQHAALDRPLPQPLVVRVRSVDGFPAQGATVTFSANSGSLFYPTDVDGNLLLGRYRNKAAVGISDAEDSDNKPNTPTSSIRINTDKDANASILYNVGNISGVNEVVASINIYGGQTRYVTFRITAGSTTPLTQTETLTVNAPPTGTVAQPFDVTVTTSDQNSGQLIAFSSTGGSFSQNSIPTDSNGQVRVQFTPSTTGSVTITASATDYTSDTATVQVSAGTAAVSTLNILTPRPVNANAGDGYNIVIDAGAPNVLVTLSGTAFQAVQGVTGTNNAVSIPITIPNTAGTYELYANAAGYSQELIVVVVTGNVVSTTDVPVRLTIPSGTSRIQTVAIQSSASLRVRVTRTDTGAAQSGVEVTFSDSGGNTLPSGVITTDSNGDATYQLPITSTARRLITAVITDTNVDKSSATPIIFDITGTVTQPTTSTRLAIIPPRDSLGQILTNTGPGATYPLTILFNNQNNTPAINQVVTLTVTNASQAVVSSTTLITDATGRATTPDTFRLPTVPGVYTIRATSGTQFQEVTVTVVAIRLVKDPSDSVSGDNQQGDRGEVLDDPFLLKVVRDINNVETSIQGVPVTFTVVDGDGELSTSSNASSGSSSITVNSDFNGDVRAYLVLGEDDEDNRVRANIGTIEVFFDATGELVPDDIQIVSGNNQQITPNRYTDPMVVHVTDENGDDLEGVDVTFSLRGPSGTLTPRIATTDRNGEAEAELFPRAAGTYFVEARVSGLTSVRFTITVGDLADSIEIVSGDNQSGEPGTELEDPLVVEVLDEDANPVSGVTVTFSITAGGGSLSDTSVTTNSRGRAETELTLGDDPGRNTVRASVSGVSDRVTFTATAEDPAPPEPDIRLPASQRVDTYWINTENGTIHSLVDNSVEEVAPNVQDVVSLVVTNDRLYWIEKTGSSSGRIRRANLNGNSIQLVRNLTTAPAGLTIDTVNGKLYVTTERGKIQSINVDGSDYEPNVIVGLDTPTDIAVDAGTGKLFWITESGTVHYANVDGSDETQFASGYNTLGGIAVGAGKVFWTEQTTDTAGTIHSADLDGENVTELVSLNAAPIGISVDTEGKKLYWTNSRGKIMQGNTNGRSLKAVVANLVSLGGISVPAGATPTRPPGTFSRYDVNKDGVVDNTDAALVADALGQTNPDNPRLDVNGDGSVNFLDLLLVFDNRENTSAAPVSVAKLPKVSREEVQKQIDLLIASNNDSLTAQQTLAYLQSLLEVVSPETTRLLANYPNPFNPETWIPYQLATSSEVQITIYNTTGNLVRTLNLGHQSKGYYTDQSSAAYWDGRNAIGEQVASGIYFYVFTANEFTATRKMLILK